MDPLELLLRYPAIAGFLVLMVLGYAFGRVGERRHYRRLIERERELNALPAVASRWPPTDRGYAQRLVSGSTVIASDYFKSFVAGLVNLFGGRVAPFESLLDRARREAMLRMKEQAEALGAAYVFNVKYETARVTAGRGAALEVLAYGTAMVPTGEPSRATSVPGPPGRRETGPREVATARPSPAGTARDGPAGPRPN